MDSTDPAQYLDDPETDAQEEPRDDGETAEPRPVVVVQDDGGEDIPDETDETDEAEA